ncbi:MAG: phosphodiester glycosidase family protein [Acidimicrobiales bacterium]
MASKKPAPRYRRHRRRSLRWRTLVAVSVLGLGLFSTSVVGAALSPGNQSFAAKWADWLRAHHAGLVAQKFEEIYYSMQAPAKGGQPKGLNKVPAPEGTAQPAQPTGTAPAGSSRTGAVTGKAEAPVTTTTTSPPGLPPPSPVPLLVHPALAGEGQWQPTGPLVHGMPAMYVAQFRADDVYTSQITTAVWIDTRLLRLELVPGSTEPGGTWAHPPYVTTAELPYLAAAFNGGFRFQDANGGIYLEGKVGVPLRPGTASLVIYDNGRVDIGAWDRDVHMTPQVQSVLQNVVLLVDDGHLAPSATYTDNAIWGYTLGGGYIVPRSGVGVTSDGALVYVAGPALSAKTLAESLQRAGAVRAMTLDINPEWVTFNFYSHPFNHPTDVTGTKLYPQMQRSAERYLPPVREARDFFEVLTPGVVQAASKPVA